MVPFDKKGLGGGPAVLQHSKADGSVGSAAANTEGPEDDRHEVSAELADAIHAKDASRVTDALHAFLTMTQNRNLEDSEASREAPAP